MGAVRSWGGGIFASQCRAGGKRRSRAAVGRWLRPREPERLGGQAGQLGEILATARPLSRHYVTYIGPPNGPTIQRTNPVRYVQY
jgi:hypothetical protein